MIGIARAVPALFRTLRGLAVRPILLGCTVGEVYKRPMEPGVRGPYHAPLFSGLPQSHESFGPQKSPYKHPGPPW